jgi:hypothetical protein
MHMYLFLMAPILAVHQPKIQQAKSMGGQMQLYRDNPRGVSCLGGAVMIIIIVAIGRLHKCSLNRHCASYANKR